MNIEERNVLYKIVFEKYGTKIQLVIAMEEMSELWEVQRYVCLPQKVSQRE